MTEYFERYDLDGSGVVRASEFTAASTASGFFFSLSECRWLAEKFKMRGVSDGVDYKSFFLWATESASRVQAVSDKLRTMVANLARKEGNMDFGPILRAFDPSETNRITKKSLKGGLNKLRLELSDSEIDVLMGHFTTDQDGNIQYEAFISFVFGEEGQSAFQRRTNQKEKSNTNKDIGMDAKEEATDAVAKLKIMVREAARKGVEYRDSFEHFDPSRTGKISRTNFKRGLKSLNIVLLDDEMDAVMTRFDPDNTGRIRYSDFLAVVAPQAQKREVDNQVQKAADRLRTMVRQRARSKNGSLRDPFQHFSEKRHLSTLRNCLKALSY